MQVSIYKGNLELLATDLAEAQSLLTWVNREDEDEDGQRLVIRLAPYGVMKEIQMMDAISRVGNN